MVNHVRLLAILNLVWGGMGLLAIGFVFLLFVGGYTALGIAEGDPVLFWFAGAFGTLFIGIFAVSALPHLLCGWGLLKKRPWARVLGIVMSAIALAIFPLGTALGVYGLYVLLHGETSLMFDKMRMNPARETV